MTQLTTEYDDILRMIKEYQQSTTDYYQKSRNLEEKINEFLLDAPSSVTVFDEYIQVQIEDKNYTNVVHEKLGTLLYKLWDGNIIIPMPHYQHKK